MARLAVLKQENGLVWKEESPAELHTQNKKLMVNNALEYNAVQCVVSYVHLAKA